MLSTHVVGTNYYAGLVGIGEQVVLMREPQNMYDHNAIRVLNISGMLNPSTFYMGTKLPQESKWGISLETVCRNGPP